MKHPGVLKTPITTEQQFDDEVTKRRDQRFKQMMRGALKELGEVPMILLLFIAAIAAGAFSSLWIAHMIDVSIETGKQLPPFLFMGRTFVIGFFSSCIAIAAFLLLLIFMVLFEKSAIAQKEDEAKDKRGHARTRRY